jgi:hypothetical protein
MLPACDKLCYASLLNANLGDSSPYVRHVPRHTRGFEALGVEALQLQNFCEMTCLCALFNFGTSNLNAVGFYQICL